MRVTTLPAERVAQRPAGEARPPFSVVVVTFNTESTNAKCLESVLRSLGATDELIVVDNASSDSTADYLRTLKDPRIQAVLNQKNVGYSIGMNQGLRLAKGEHVVMLNPDTQVPPRWLERMRAHFRDARVGAVGPVSDRAGGCQRFEFYLPEELKGAFGVDELGEAIYTANAGKALEAKTLIGFCLMVGRRAIDAVGLLDEDLVLGNDDLEYCWRLRNAGFKVVAATDVFVHHEEQVSFKTVPSETTRKMVQESTDALATKLLKHYGEGQVPSSRELFGVDWFKPSFDLWPQATARIPLSDLEKDATSGVCRRPAPPIPVSSSKSDPSVAPENCRTGVERGGASSPATTCSPPAAEYRVAGEDKGEGERRKTPAKLSSGSPRDRFPAVEGDSCSGRAREILHSAAMGVPPLDDLPGIAALAPGEQVLLIGCPDNDLVHNLNAKGVSVVSVERNLDWSQVEFDQPFDAAVVRSGGALRDDLDAVARALKADGRLLLYPDAGLGKRELLALLLSAGFDGAEIAEDGDGGQTVSAVRERR
jgi:GT2 family glycosyltransferase